MCSTGEGRQRTVLVWSPVESVIAQAVDRLQEASRETDHAATTVPHPHPHKVGRVYATVRGPLQDHLARRLTAVLGPEALREWPKAKLQVIRRHPFRERKPCRFRLQAHPAPVESRNKLRIRSGETSQLRPAGRCAPSSLLSSLAASMRNPDTSQPGRPSACSNVFQCSRL